MSATPLPPIRQTSAAYADYGSGALDRNGFNRAAEAVVKNFGLVGVLHRGSSLLSAAEIRLPVSLSWSITRAILSLR